jgi:ribosomal protein S4E
MSKVEKINNAYRVLFDEKNDFAKTVLLDLCKSCQIFERTHVPGDPYSSAFNEGRRTVILGILRKIHRDAVALSRQFYEEQLNEQQTHHHD